MSSVATSVIVANADNAQAILDQMMRAALPNEAESAPCPQDPPTTNATSAATNGHGEKKRETDVQTGATESDVDAAEKESDDQSRRVSKSEKVAGFFVSS